MYFLLSYTNLIGIAKRFICCPMIEQEEIYAEKVISE
jgi:hypothetical protein